jgi:hypothetical protein
MSRTPGIVLQTCSVASPTDRATAAVELETPPGSSRGDLAQRLIERLPLYGDGWRRTRPGSSLNEHALSPCAANKRLVTNDF